MATKKQNQESTDLELDLENYVNEVETKTDSDKGKKSAVKETESKDTESPYVAEDDVDVRKANIEKLRNQMLQGKGATSVSYDSNHRMIVDEDNTYANNTNGFININISDLPSRGKFYPLGFEVRIKSASVADIREWSMVVEDDLAQTDAALNKILKSCVQVYVNGLKVSWKNILDVDRFYIVMSIRDLTFPDDSNPLMIQIDEDLKIPVSKDAVDFITLPEELDRFYDENERCYIINTQKNTFKLSLPTIGLASWLKTYTMTKIQKKEPFSTDFVSIAPYLRFDYRMLEANEKVFETAVKKYKDFDLLDISALAEFKNLISESVNLTFRYVDGAGAEVTVPFSFLGGFKNFFVLQNTLSKLS